MKVVPPFIYVCFLLICGGNFLFASTHTSISNSQPSYSLIKQNQLSTSNQLTTAIDLTDIDLEEDYLNHDETSAEPNCKFQLELSRIIPKWYRFYVHTAVHSTHKFQPFLALEFLVFSNPFYITQRVLRIWFLIFLHSNFNSICKVKLILNWILV